MRRCKQLIMCDEDYHYHFCSRAGVVDGYCKQHAASRERKKRAAADDPRTRAARLDIQTTCKRCGESHYVDETHICPGARREAVNITRDFPFYIVNDQGDVWATHACPGGTSSTLYGKHDAVVQELSDKIAALERCVKAADKLRDHSWVRNLGAFSAALDYDAVRAAVEGKR